MGAYFFSVGDGNCPGPFKNVANIPVGFFSLLVTTEDVDRERFGGILATDSFLVCRLVELRRTLGRDEYTLPWVDGLLKELCLANAAHIRVMNQPLRYACMLPLRAT